MQLVSYGVKEDDFNQGTFPISSSRYGWIQDGKVVDALFAEQWLLQGSTSVVERRLPKYLLELIREGATIWRYFREIHQFLSGGGVDQLRVDGEPVAIELDQVDLLSPILSPSAIFTADSLTNIVGDFQHVPYISSQDSSMDLILQWGAVVGEERETLKLNESMDAICGYVLMIHVQSSQVNQVYLGPFLRTKDEWVDPDQGIQFSMQIDGEQHMTGQMKLPLIRLQELMVQISQERTLLPGDVFASAPLVKPISLTQCESLSWNIEGFGSLHLNSINF